MKGSWYMSGPPERQAAVKEWLVLADADHKAALHLNSVGNEKLHHIVGFHVQQAIEKWIKAILTEQGVDFPRTHDLGALMTLLGANFTSPIAISAIERISDFAVTTRYPMPDDPITGIEIANALSSAHKFAKAVQTHLAHYYPLDNLQVDPKPDL
jgi:HEPN domain-containing protein